MEFRRGSLERRQERRVCPSCLQFCGAKARCPKCRKKTAARIQISWYVGSKRFRLLTGHHREHDALAVLQRKEADYWRQQQLGTERDIGGTLRAAVDAFSAAQAGISANYRKQIGTATNALADQLSWHYPVHLIAPLDMLRFREDALGRLAPPTVRSYMLVLRRFFAFLHQEGWIRRNPVHKLRLPAPKGRKDHLRPHEVGPVLDAFWRVCPPIAPIATALVLGGWRKGEIVNLRHADVDLAGGWAYVLDFEGDALTEAWSPKTASSVRAVPLHPLVVRALERTPRVARPDGSPSPWVFPVVDRRKRQRRRDRLGRLHPVRGDRRAPGTGFLGAKLREVLEAAGVERRITIHGLRRTFAVLLQEAGAPDSIIRQALGHGQRGVTELNYLPRRDATVKRWVEAISVTVPALDAPFIEPPRDDSE